jgi:peptidyl-dipeptidase A
MTVTRVRDSLCNALVLGAFLVTTSAIAPPAGAATPPAAAPAAKAPAPSKAAAPTLEEARRFLEAANARLLDLNNRQQRAEWVQSTFITDDTERMAAEARETVIAAVTELAQGARRFDRLTLPPDLARQMKLIKLSLTLPAPADPALRSELTQIASTLEGIYGKGKYCPAGTESECQDIGDLSRVLAENREPAKLLEAWRGWHTIAPPMRPKFERYVALANQGAREMGFADVGAMWRSKYDMTPDAFASDIERVWGQVKPLYDALHAYVRGRLVEKYGAAAVPAEGPIPAHLLGNLWAQDWSNIYPLVAPPNADPGYDVSALLKARKLDARGMVRAGEGFFTSLGLEPLPPTFWERSLFTQPADRDVVCHASAWDVDNDLDLRIKMCIEITAEDFSTIHHELGHNYYQRAYRTLPYLFRDSANDGFHEALGDTIALSVTPAYLKQIGLLDRDPAPGSDIGLLLRMALERVAFLPFGLLVDQWRWKVFSGEIAPADYNRTWWELKRKYQGVVPGVARSEADFDPGAKYHVAANVPYTRYFLAAVLQFQFHRALLREAGYSGPPHLGSIYGNKAAGAKLAAMMALGQSKPWPQALEAMTGETRTDATAMVEYFAPLKKWLDEQNRGKKVGWSEK